MTTFGSSLKAALLSPLLPFWLVIALLPFGRSAELGTLLCLLGVIMLFAREPSALRQHPGARLLLWLLAAYVAAALFSAVVRDAFGQRRKTLRNALSNLCDAAAIEAAGVRPDARAEQIEVADFKRLANHLAALPPGRRPA